MRRFWLHRLVIVSVLLCVGTGQARAWGQEGHAIVALIAHQLLEPRVVKGVDALLASDADELTAHDIASESYWADKYRDSDRGGSKRRYLGTRQWHFAARELSAPSYDAACFGHPALPAGVVASEGPAQACVIDKIEQFAAELAAPRIGAEERLLALKYLLHLIGDVHQPLHVSSRHDAGGNATLVLVGGVKVRLHEVWDVNLVEGLGVDADGVAKALLKGMTVEERRAWETGDAASWALEGFEVAVRDAYGLLPIGGQRGLGPVYLDRGEEDVGRQLSRAGVRLAMVLGRGWWEGEGCELRRRIHTGWRLSACGGGCMVFPLWE